MFGLGKRKELAEPVEVLQQDEGTMGEMWGVDTSQGMVWETVCAWCLAEQGIAPDPADSHGICASHHAHVLQLYRKSNAHSSS